MEVLVVRSGKFGLVRAQRKGLPLVNQSHRFEARACGQRRAVRCHDDLNGMLVRFWSLLDERHHPLLQLRMQVRFGLFDEQQPKLIGTAKQDEFRGHEQRVVVSKAPWTALGGVDHAWGE